MKLELEPYQKQAKNFVINTPSCGLFLQPGMGKTAITLSALHDLAQQRAIYGHVLVIAPKNIARSTWIDEILKWDFNFRYKSLIVDENGKKLTKKQREELYVEALTAKPTIYFINRDLVKSLVDFYVDRDVKPNGQYRFSQGWIFKNIIIDELQSFKSYNSQRFTALKTIMPDVQRFIGLTGTPTPNGLEDLWSEIYLMDRGRRLGKNITTYRRTFFNTGRIVNGYPIEYIPKPGAEDEIYKRIKDIVISLKNTTLNLPPITYNDIYVHMTPSEQTLYKTFAKTQVLEVLGKNNETVEIVASNAAILTAKLSQIASGAIYMESGAERSTAPVYKVIHEHKLDQLEYIVNNTDSPVLVAYHFKSDKDMICKRFNSLKDAPDAVVFDGSPEMVHAWNDRKIPLMLIQPASAGFGLNLQSGGHTLVWYTISWSLEEYLQTIARLYRKGQPEPVIVHHLLTDKTIDKRILDRVIKKDANETNLLEAVRMALDDIDITV